jgi:hypothetical protein
VLDKSVQSLLGFLILVTLAVQADADTVWDIADTTGPDELVQTDINTDIIGSHLLLGKGSELLDGVTGTLLERDTMDALVQVYGVLTADNISRSRLLAHFDLERTSKIAQGERGIVKKNKWYVRNMINK